MGSAEYSHIVLFLVANYLLGPHFRKELGRLLERTATVPMPLDIVPFICYDASIIFLHYFIL